MNTRYDFPLFVLTWGITTVFAYIANPEKNMFISLTLAGAFFWGAATYRIFNNAKAIQ